MSGYEREIWYPRQTYVTAARMNRLEAALFHLKNEIRRPEDYGAVGDGVTDDTGALLDCMDDTTSGGVMLLARNTSYLTGELALRDRGSIVGLGYDSKLKPKPGTTRVINLNGAHNCILSNFTIEAVGVGGIGVGGSGGTNLLMEKVRTANCTQGMVAVLGYLSQIRNCNLGGSLYGLHVQAGSVDSWIVDNEIYAGPYASQAGSRSAIFEGGPLRVVGNHFHGDPGYNIFMYPASWVNLTGNIFEGGQLAGVRLELPSYYGDGGNLWDISHNFFTQLADNATGLQLLGYDADQRIGDCIVDSNRFLSANPAGGSRMTYAVDLANAINIRGGNNIWRNQFDGAGAVNQGANCSLIDITGG